MGFVGSEPSQASVSSAGILDGAIVDADINASAAIAMSKTAFSDGTGITLSTNTLNVDASQAITALTGGDLTIYDDANNADVSFSMGTSATESLIIQVLNGGSNKTAEAVHFSTATASGTADHGSMVFDIDGADILTIDDGGISIVASGAYEVSGTAILSDSSGTMTLSNVDALDATTEATVEGAIDTLVNLTAAGAVANAFTLTYSDMTLFHDANNADTSFSIGTSATEALKIEVLNGGSNKTAEAVHFSTATASGTADHGSMVFDIDGTDILTIDDGGLVVKTASTIGPVGDEDLLTLTASGSIVTVAGELSVTTLDIGGTNIASTATELNLLDGSAKSTASITIADTDAFIIIDGTTTKQIPASDIAAYAGGGGGSFEATANGAISAGDRVALRSDGDVETCEALQAGEAFGTAASPNGTEFETGQTYYQSAAFDPDNNKIGVCYRDSGNSSYPTIVVGGITDAAAGDFAFGTPVVLESGAFGEEHRLMAYDTSVDRFVTVYTRNGSGIRCVVWAVDNTSTNTITKGSVQVIDNSNKNVASVFDSNANRVLACYMDSDDSNKLIAQAFTARGGTDNDIQTLGAKLFICAAISDPPLLCFDSNDNKVMVMYAESTDSGYPYARALTIDASDNSITGGTAVRLTNDNAISTAGNGGFLLHDPVKNINIASHQGSSSQFEAWLFTSASGSITAGQHILINDTTDDTTMGNFVTGVYDPDNAKVIFFNGQSGILGTVGVISGTGADATFTIEARTRIHPRSSSLYSSNVAGGGNVEYVDSIYDTNSNKSVILYKSTSGDTGNFALIPILAKNATAFIGFSNDAVSNDATATITTTGGVATGQSSLTIGSEYFVDSLGALTTTSGTVFAGKALTATTVLVNAPRV